MFWLPMAWGLVRQSFNLPFDHWQVTFALFGVLTEAQDEGAGLQPRAQARELQIAGKIRGWRRRLAAARVPLRPR